MPLGTFAADAQPGAYAAITGHIVAAAERANSLTQVCYAWARVESAGGCFCADA